MKNHLFGIASLVVEIVAKITTSIRTALSDILYGYGSSMTPKANWGTKKKDTSNDSNLKNLKFDSRNIPPPRNHNTTEINLCAGGQVATTIDLNGTKGFRTQSLPSNINYILDYSRPEVHASIYWFKYRRDKYTTKLLAEILWDKIVELISEKFDNCQKIRHWIITSAPSTSYINGEKNWDHGVELLNILKKISGNGGNLQNIEATLDTEFEYKFDRKFEYREIFTTLTHPSDDKKKIEKNKKLNRNSRINNSNKKFMLMSDFIADYLYLKQNFQTNQRNRNHGLIIFDDVTTTGSTLLSLEKITLDSKCFEKVLLLALAH